MDRSAVAPVPPARPHRIVARGGVRTDEYYWLRDDHRSDPEVLAHLAAENTYTDAVLAPVAATRDLLYREMVGRIPQDDATVPARLRGHLHYRRFVAGAEHPLIMRRPAGNSTTEELVLDVNALARDHAYYGIGGCFPSPDDRLIAFTEDTVGQGAWTLRFRDLVTGAFLRETIFGVAATVAWFCDSRRVAYVQQHPDTQHGWRLRCHLLGTNPLDDAIVYEERDECFELSVMATKDERYLLLLAENSGSTEWRYLDAAGTAMLPRLFLAREPRHEYEPEHLDGRWIVRTNWLAPNFRVVEIEVGREADRDRWRDVVAHRDDALIHDFEVFQDFLVVEERLQAQRRLRIHRRDGTRFAVDAGEAVCTMEIDENPELDSDVVRFVQTSPTMPDATCEVDANTGAVRVLKRKTVHGFEPARYLAELVWVQARDGEVIPVTITRRRDVPLDGTAPLLQTGYGAYGICDDPVFGAALLSLLDRGFVHAIAHVRGGEELGRRWFDAGRLSNKMASFNDFVDVTADFLRRGLVDPQRIFASGGSAGGLLVAAVANMAPDFYRGIVATAPFVDVLTTMLDEGLPLTALEYDLWGDPRDPDAYRYILGYSPYDNVRAQGYPAVYATTGLWDGQVQYYEPAKWVARLRRCMTGGGPVLLRVDLDAGHSGRPGRFEHLWELAEQYAFLLDLAVVGVNSLSAGSR